MNERLIARLPEEHHPFSDDFEQRLLERIAQNTAEQRRRALPSRRQVLQWAAMVLLLLQVILPCAQSLMLHPSAYREGVPHSCIETGFTLPFSGKYWLVSEQEVDVTLHPVTVTSLPEGVQLTHRYESPSGLTLCYAGDGWMIYISQEMCKPNGEYEILDLSDADQRSLVNYHGETVLQALYDNHSDIRYVRLHKEERCYLIGVLLERYDGSSHLPPEDCLDTAYSILEGCVLSDESEQ